MLKGLQKADKYLITLVGVFLLFGLIMIYSSTSIYSQGNLGSAFKLVILQVGWILIGLIGFNFFLNINYKKLKKFALPLFLISLIFLLILALVSLFGNCSSGGLIFTPCINGAYRWFYINPPPLPEIPLLGVLGFQPSEFAKLTAVVYLAVLLEKNIKEKENPFLVFIIISGLTALLVFLQPNLSTALLILAIGFSMYFVSGANLIPFFVTVPAAVFSALGLILTSQYRRERLLTFLSPSESGELSLGYHIKQIQIAFGSGGIWGLGFGQSRQKFKYLPEVAADSIFAIVGEELGFIGTTIFVILFALLIYRGFYIAKNSKDLLGRLLATGVTTWIAAQFFVNIAAMLRIIPLTGVPLPLVSYGGSAMVFSLMGLGILANVSKTMRE